MKLFHLPLFVFSALFAATLARATLGSSLQMQLGNPSSATSDSGNHTRYLIQRAQYAIDYNDTTHEPNWVSWDLTDADVGGSGRADFAVDPTLPTGFRRVLTTDYVGSGFDRGHMCPSADRTVTTADNQVTFYMSNMVPQTPDNNQGVWANFEAYCRTLASAGNEILLTCGPGGFTGATIASGVAIPTFTWKIAVVVPLGAGSALSRVTATTRVIALKIPNIAGIRSTPWQNFVTSTAQIEAETGYTFFTELAPAVASVLRARIDGQTSSDRTLLNLSTRARVNVGAENAIAGFTISGSEAKTLLIRAVGPTLTTLGVSGALAAPRLEVLRGSTVLATNVGWSTSSNAAAIADAASRAGAFPLPNGSADCAILATLAPGGYTALVSTSDGRPGVGLVEIYDASGPAGSSAARLANLSTRAATGIGADAAIAGLVIGGTTPKRVLLRAAGPSLTQFGVSGVLARPQLTLFSGSTILAQNAGWSTSAEAAVIADAANQAGAFAFTSGSADSAIVIALAPGNYTAHVTGVGDASGVALVEVYELP